MIRMPKTYPAYFGTYDRFDEIRNYVDRFANLFLVGRNGMHKYNNQDHSMLTAITAVDNIVDRSRRQVEYLGRQHRAGISRRERVAPGGAYASSRRDNRAERHPRPVPAAVPV